MKLETKIKKTTRKITKKSTKTKRETQDNLKIPVHKTGDSQKQEQKPVVYDPDDFLTVKEAAEMLRISEGTLYRLARQRKIRSIKVGGCIRFKKSDLFASDNDSSFSQEVSL